MKIWILEFMRYKRTLFLISLLILGAAGVRAQENSLNPTVHGNFQFDAQSYMTDEALGITDSVLQHNPSRGFETRGYPGIFFLGAGAPQVTRSTITA